MVPRMPTEDVILLPKLLVLPYLDNYLNRILLDRTVCGIGVADVPQDWRLARKRTVEDAEDYQRKSSGKESR